MAFAVNGCTTVADIAGVQRTGVQSDGSYVLSAAETDANCRALDERIESELTLIRKQVPRISQEKAELPQTVTALLGRTFGGANDGLASRQILRESEARVRALDRAAGEKGCIRPNVEDRLRTATTTTPA